MKSTPRLNTRDHDPRRADQCNLHTHVIANNNKSPIEKNVTRSSVWFEPTKGTPSAPSGFMRLRNYGKRQDGRVKSAQPGTNRRNAKYKPRSRSITRARVLTTRCSSYVMDGSTRHFSGRSRACSRISCRQHRLQSHQPRHTHERAQHHQVPCMLQAGAKGLVT